MSATLLVARGHSVSSAAECFGCSHGEGVRKRDRRSAGMLGITWMGGKERNGQPSNRVRMR